jgi:hypothetical protein
MAKVNKTASDESPKLIKIQFILSPSGKFDLAYNVGEIAEINANQANEIVEAGYAEFLK